MYKVYCLINPIDNLPFYVGATNRDLDKRLQGHISGRNSTDKCYKVDSIMCKRNDLIKEIVSTGNKPIISLLTTTDSFNVDFLEFSFYKHFINLGIQLLQNQYRFTYRSHYCKNNLKISHK